MTSVTSTSDTSVRTGGRILIDQLLRQGVERVTCVPGESYLAALDALYGSAIDVMVCRAEGGAAMMAEAYGKPAILHCRLDPRAQSHTRDYAGGEGVA